MVVSLILIVYLWIFIEIWKTFNTDLYEEIWFIVFIIASLVEISLYLYLLFKKKYTLLSLIIIPINLILIIFHFYSFILFA
jgi:hypothetical protein